jgi:hypothetical protein
VVYSFDVEGVRGIHLESDVLNLVGLPKLELVSRDHHERKSELHQNSLDVLGALFSGVLCLDGDVHKSERTVERFGTHELLSAVQDELDVGLAKRWSVLLLELSEELLEVRRSLALCLSIAGSISSIFSQTSAKRGQACQTKDDTREKNYLL